MADCRIDMLVDCLVEFLSCTLGIGAAGVAVGTDSVVLQGISVVDSQVMDCAVAAVHTGLDFDCHGLWFWSRPLPKDCDQPFCE